MRRSLAILAKQQEALQREELLPGPTKKPVLLHSTIALTEGRNGDHGRLRDSILFPRRRRRPEIHDRQITRRSRAPRQRRRYPQYRAPEPGKAVGGVPSSRRQRQSPILLQRPLSAPPKRSSELSLSGHPGHRQ